MKVLSSFLIAGLGAGLLAAQSSTTATSISPQVPVSAAQGGEVDPCGAPAYVRVAVDPSGLNLQGALTPMNLPTIGNSDFIVCMDDPSDTCGITPGSETWMLVSDGSFISVLVPGAGCQPGDQGLLMIDVFSPSFHLEGPVVWDGPGNPACHSLVIPNDRSLCGVECVGQGVFVDTIGPSGPFVLTEPLRFGLGS